MSDHYDRLKSALADRYAIDREIGRGGMAVVYLAEDLKHGRQVAIKVLQPSLSATLGTDRFLREIETAARLNHPHILPLYDSGEADGFLYYVMPYVEGESLRDRIDREVQLPVEESVRLTREVAGGLGYAHKEGVVHRDIKPGNIMMSQGHAVIADFGIAQAVDEAGGEKLTSTGVSTGSPVYMSPEQARGSERLDGRTDVYSLGCVLYEMLAGEPPFTGGTHASITARKELESAPSLRTLRDTVSQGVEGAVTKALAKVPADRFGNAEDFAAALAARSSTARGYRKPRPRVRRAVIVGVVLLGATVVYAALQDRDPGANDSDPAMEDARPAIAVLPFVVRGEGLEIWRYGMVDVLSTNLEGVPGVRTIPSNTILARWSEATSADQPADLQTQLQVASRAGARYAVIGRANAAGQSLRLDADLYDVSSAEILEQAHAEGTPEELLQLVDELSLDVMRAIGSGEAAGIPRFDLAGSMSGSINAVKQYLEGAAHRRRNDLEAAAASFEEAIALDSTFALAHFGLVEAYTWADGGHGQRAPEASARAQRLIDQPVTDLPIAIQLQLAGWSNPEILPLAQRAVREHPDDARLWDFLGEVYTHRGGQFLIEPLATRDAFARVIELDPGLTFSYQHVLTEAYRLEPDSARIVQIIDALEANGGDSVYVYEERVAHAIAFGDSANREWGYQAVRDWPLTALTPGAMARWRLNHPLFLPQRAEVFRIASRREDWLEPRFSDWLVVRSAFDRGRVDEALRELEVREVREGLLLPELLRIYDEGLPVPVDVVASILASPVPDTIMSREYMSVGDGGTRIPLLYTTAYAISEGTPGAAAAAIRRFHAAADYHTRTGNGEKAKAALGAAKAIEGLDSWKNGRDFNEARRLLDEVRMGELFRQWQDNRALRWWLAELLAESGQYREAVPYYVSLADGSANSVFDTPAVYRLGQAYEQLGEVENARRAYAWVLLAWRDADESMQPWIAAIEQRLQALGADIGS